MEKLKRYSINWGGREYGLVYEYETDGDWCRSEDVDRLESELELALSCLNEDQLDEMETKRLDTAL